MIFGTVCSGIGAPEAAWARLGWRSAFMSEIDAFPRAVLTHHYPAVPLHGDFTTIQAGDYEPIDLLCGGTPCQSFSIAGLRGGMADERGNLALEFLRLADRLRPRWVVWENVPGVRSSGSGRDFGAILGGLGELGYGWAYRSLDAQYAGLAQRRERVFVVGYLGDWRPAAAVLFEPAGLRGNPAPRREAGERTARPIAAGSPGGSGYRNDADTADNLIARCLTSHPSRSDGESETFIALDIVPAMTTRTGTGRDGMDEYCVAHTLRGEGFDASEDGTGRGVPLVPFSFPWQQGGSMGFTGDNDLAGTLVKNQTMAMAVRRLTPRECERLQGFPDDYTLVPYRNGMAADGPRYKALGNSMAVPVVAWIGRRIGKIDAQMRAHKEQSAWTA